MSTVKEQLVVAESPKAGNFVARFWRGEYSLGVSYWVFGIGINIVLIINLVLLTLLVFALGGNEHQALLAASPASAILLVLYSIGLLSSTENHVARTGRKGWAFAAIVMLAIGWMNVVSEFLSALQRTHG